MSGYHTGEVEAKLLCHSFLPVAIIPSWLYSWKNPTAESGSSGGERIGFEHQTGAGAQRSVIGLYPGEAACLASCSPVLSESTKLGKLNPDAP